VGLFGLLVGLVVLVVLVGWLVDLFVCLVIVVGAGEQATCSYSDPLRLCFQN
jgi:hypothetical protein